MRSEHKLLFRSVSQFVRMLGMVVIGMQDNDCLLSWLICSLKLALQIVARAMAGSFRPALS